MTTRSALPPPRLACSLALVLVSLLASPLRAAKKTEAPMWIGVDATAPTWKNVEELRAFADRGNQAACFELGDRLMNGDGVKTNPSEARVYFARAARDGHPDALFRLGKIYHDGLGVARDRARGFEFYTQAAQRGVPEAMHNVGAMLVSGRGVKRDYIEGLAWLIVATKHGAVSMAEQQVRKRLEHRPDDSARAEARAKVLLAEMKKPGVVPTPDAKLLPPTPAEPRAPNFAPAPSAAPAVDVPAPQFTPPVTVPLSLPGAPRKPD
ncbi:MAG: tetratricopeptide repeat protein [Candidatus Didemnitutus sp.]|nr:tetratricopeptide repeat protein [Candidatus Didemnitutus sp.]